MFELLPCRLTSYDLPFESIRVVSTRSRIFVRETPIVLDVT